MRISLSWLADYVDLPEPDALAHRLTMAGLEVEGRERLGAGLERVVVGKIVSSSAHPNAEKLSVTQVDVGQGAPLQIVCGAKNYAVGDCVPVAQVGAQLPGGMNITQATLRGVESSGMLCSARELGLSDDHAGLLILDPGLALGTPIADALYLRDAVFEVNVTPNRPDALSHLGIAREVHALTGAALRPPHTALTEVGAPTGDRAAVRIDAPTLCPRYLARVIEGVSLGPSPAWMQARLRAAGVRAINNVVDVTNYVLLELGHPLHAFDLEKLRGAQVVVRLAQAGETLTTLDGKARTLVADDLVIADAERAVALAGVMGGADAEVTQGTTRLLLESAYFNPSSVRRTARRHGLHSEASHRFERGTDIDGAPNALERAARLIAELAGGEVRVGAIDVYPVRSAPRTAPLRFKRLAEVLGAAIPSEDCARILTALGFRIVEQSPTSLSVEIPARRPDVTLEEDLIEEVARIWGYEAVPAVVPRIASSEPAEPRADACTRRVRGALMAAGLSEVLNYSFVSHRELEAVDPQRALGQPITLLNPISAEQSAMRTSLLPGLFQNLTRSLRHQTGDVRFYELGRIYRPATDAGGAPAVESLRVAGVLFGNRMGTTWAAPREPVDFYDAKGAVEGVLQSLGIAATFSPDRALPAFHPRKAASVMGPEGRLLGSLGEVHPRVCGALQLPDGLFAFDLDLEALIHAAELVAHDQGLPRFPAVLRDLALVVDETVTHGQLEAVIRAAGSGLVDGVTLFDVYRGTSIPAGRKSLAYAIRYRASDRTLTDGEAQSAHAQIVAALGSQAGAEVRA